MSDVPTKEARTYLEGNGVYTHLVETLLTILDEKPVSPLDAFEAVSTSIKAGDDPAVCAPVDESTLVRAKEVTEMIAPTLPEVAEGEEAPAEPEKNEPEDVRDLIRDADLLEKAGVGLGKSESYRVAMAVKQLSENADHGVKTARFFGKIFGTQQDYLVCETELAEAGEATELSEEDVAAGVVPPDAPGTGCNKFVYFVCSRPGTAWTKLPDVLPAQLMAARQIKKLVTGVLDTPIEGYPVFPGTEANYLRCQIAQIAAATGIVPKGVFKGPWDEEDYEAPEVGSEEAMADPELVPLTDEEDFANPTSLVPLTDASGWVRESRALLTRQGRCSWYTQPVPEPDEDAPAPAPPPTPEPSPAGLAALSADAPVASGVPAWSFRKVCSGLDNSEAAVAKSLAWPGAATACDLNGIKGFYWASVYVGNGSQYAGASYSPPMPPAMATEAEDPVEETDPTVEEEEAANAPAEGEGEEE